MKLILIVIVTALFMDLSNGAPIKSEEFAKEIERVVEAYVRQEMNYSIRPQRATGEANEDSSADRNCYDAPCGWFNYNPHTRRSTVFMSNNCKCPDESYKCVRTGENVSINAYVYRCRQNTTPEDITAIEDGS